jgi:hypothetical protein
MTEITDIRTAYGRWGNCPTTSSSHDRWDATNRARLLWPVRSGLRNRRTYWGLIPSSVAAMLVEDIASI